MDTTIRKDDSTFFAQGLHAGGKKRSGGIVISTGKIPLQTTLEALFDEAKARFDTLGFTAVERTREFAEPFDLNGLYVATYLPKDSTVATTHVHLIFQIAPNGFLEIYRACVKSELEWNVFLVSEVFYDLRLNRKPLINRWGLEESLSKQNE